MVVMTHVSVGRTRQRTQGIVSAILAGWELDATQNVLVMGHLMEINACVTMTRAIRESSVTSRDVPDCTNSTVVAEVAATVRQRNVAVMPAGQDEAVRLPTALVRRTVTVMVIATQHWRHLYVSVTMVGLVTRVTYSVFMVTNNLLAVTTACVTLVGRRSNATWNVHCTGKSPTTSASAILVGGESCATYQDALETNLTAQVTAYATRLSTSAHATQVGWPVLVTSPIVPVSTAVDMVYATPPSTPHAVQTVSLGGWARGVTSHVSVVHRLHQTVASVNVTHALPVKGVTVNVLDTGNVTV